MHEEIGIAQTFGLKPKKAESPSISAFCLFLGMSQLANRFPDKYILVCSSRSARPDF